jgi:hypothetical protein
MSFFSHFDKTAGGRRQTKFANMKARYRHEQNRAKYKNRINAFKANENERVLGTSRARSDAYRKLVIGARGKARKGAEQAYKAFAKARKGPTGEGSSRAQFSDFERLLQAQAGLEHKVSLASGEGLALQMQGIGRKDLSIHRKNVGQLGIPASAPLMAPYEKENKFMTFMNFASWAAKTATTAGKLDAAGEAAGWWK